MTPIDRADVELRHLCVLAAVVSEGSLRRAARRLHVSPATIARSLAMLEAALQQRLVDRDPRGARPTGAGRLLAEHADGIVASLRTARDELDAFVAGETASLRIGAAPGPGSRLLPHLLAALHADGRRMRVGLVECPTAGVAFGALADGTLDLVLAELPLPAGAYEHCELVEDPYVLLVSARSPLAERAEPLSAGDLRSLQLVGPRDAAARDRLEGVLRGAGLRRGVAALADDPRTLQAYIGTGIAAAVAPRLSVDVADPGTVAIDVGHLLHPSTVALAWATRAARRPGVIAAREAARTAVEALESCRALMARLAE